MTDSEKIECAIHCMKSQAGIEVCEECMAYDMDDSTCKEIATEAFKSLEEVQEYRKLGTLEEVKEAVEKQKPKKVIIRAWEPCKCPTCSKELSKSMGDGYYKHYYYLKRCTECGQKLNWGDNDD